MSQQRVYDVILYGASGFVGRQTAAYFAKHGAGLRWALAGRNYDKLVAARRDAGPGAAQAGIEWGAWQVLRNGGYDPVPPRHDCAAHHQHSGA